VILRRLDELQRRCVPLGFGHAVVRKYLDDGGAREAALITYYGFLSFFPLLLLGTVVLSRFLASAPDLRAEVIAGFVPPGLQAGIADAVETLSRSRSALVVGLLGLAYSGSGVVFSAYYTLNHLAAVPVNRRSGLLSRCSRVFAGLVVVLAGTLAVGVLTMVPRAIGMLGTALVAGGVLLVVARILLERPAPLRHLWPAALIGAVAVTATIHLGTLLLPRLVRGAGLIYGGFATVAGVFTLLYVLSNALLLAAETAAVAAAGVWPRALDPSRPAEADHRAQQLLTREQDRLPPPRDPAGPP
jgi:membrane protein